MLLYILTLDVLPWYILPWNNSPLNDTEYISVKRQKNSILYPSRENSMPNIVIIET